MERVILHADLNNFYASVECLYNPSLWDKPVAVGGDAERRHGIVLAKNELAKKYGVQTGETLWQARQKCPALVFVPPHFERYLRYSKLAKEIYAAFTDQVEPFGLDECWLDVSGSTRLFGSGRTIADTIRREIRRQLGVSISVGVSFNKIFAKLGSDMKKPDATTVISRGNFKDTVWPLPVGDLLYVGRATRRKLAAYGVDTIGQLAGMDVHALEYVLGKNGRMLWEFANGMDTSPVRSAAEKPMVKSVGNSTTAPRDLTSEQDMKITLYVLCESVAARLREYGLECAAVQVSLRDNALYTYERQGRLGTPTDLAESIFELAYALIQQHKPEKPIRSVGVRGYKLSPAGETQLSFLPAEHRAQKCGAIERAVDGLRARFGYSCIQRGILLADPFLAGVNPKEDHVIHPVGFVRG